MCTAESPSAECDGASCPPSHLYIIASRGSHIADDLETIFPGAHVVPWKPIERKLTGKVAEAAAYVLQNAKDGTFVSDREVMKHLGWDSKANYNRRIKRHDDFIDALAEQDITAHKQGRLTGFQKSAAIYFGQIEEHE